MDRADHVLFLDICLIFLLQGLDGTNRLHDLYPELVSFRRHLFQGPLQRLAPLDGALEGRPGPIIVNTIRILNLLLLLFLVLILPPTSRAGSGHIPFFFSHFLLFLLLGYPGVLIPTHMRGREWRRRTERVWFRGRDGAIESRRQVLAWWGEGGWRTVGEKIYRALTGAPDVEQGRGGDRFRFRFRYRGEVGMDRGGGSGFIVVAVFVVVRGKGTHDR